MKNAPATSVESLRGIPRQDERQVIQPLEHIRMYVSPWVYDEHRCMTRFIRRLDDR